MSSRELLTRQVIDAANAARQRNEPLCFAIDGPGCAGKSTFALELKKKYEQLGIPACVLPINNFCNPRAVRYSGSANEELDIYKYNFNYDLLETALSELLNGEAGRFTHKYLNSLTDEYDGVGDYAVSDGGVLIVEGVHALRYELRRWYNFSVFLDVGEEEQMKRARVRDIGRGNSLIEIERKYAFRYRPSFRHYLTTHNPVEYANFVVDNSRPRFPTWTARSKC